MTVAEQLRHAREEAGLTLRQVADQTKIQQWILAAIERDDLSHVPGGVFIRGYLMSLARAVGLDAEEVWAAYRAELRARTVEPAPVPVPKHVPSIGPWTIVRVAAILLVAAVVWRNTTRNHPDIASTPPAAAQPRAADVVPVAAPTKGSAREAIAAVDSDPVAVATAPLQLRLHATAEVWVDARVDGEQRVYRLVSAGEDVSIEASGTIALRIGDAAAVTYTINGAPGRPLGGRGVVRDIVISPTTYQSLIAPGAL